MTSAEALLAGPRGRRLLLAYAMGAESIPRSECNDDSFGAAVFLASYHLAASRGTAGVLFGPGAEELRQVVVTPREVAERLSRVPLPEVTPVALRSALAHAVDMARYWQDPDGEDILVATEPVRLELRRVAEHIARSPHVDWWTTALVAADQWLVGWVDERTESRDSTAAEQAPTEQAPTEQTAAELLRAWRDETAEEELRSERDRPADPSAGWSGWWWSTPPTRSSARLLRDGTPAGLWFVEDSMDWKRAVARRVNVPVSASVYEVDGPQAWADLCRRFPVDVTAQKRHDWYRTTGRSGRWVVPDWPRIAERYDGVHLTVGGYLTAAGTAIDVDAGTASVIAGWAPDETYWLTDSVSLDSNSRAWVCDTSREHLDWEEEHR